MPVVVTSLSRRNYRDGQLVEDLTAYVNAAKRMAAEENVTLIDLNAMSVKLLKGMTQRRRMASMQLPILTLLPKTKSRQSRTGLT